MNAQDADTARPCYRCFNCGAAYPIEFESTCSYCLHRCWTHHEHWRAEASTSFDAVPGPQHNDGDDVCCEEHRYDIHIRRGGGHIDGPECGSGA